MKAKKRLDCNDNAKAKSYLSERAVLAEKKNRNEYGYLVRPAQHLQFSPNNHSLAVLCAKLKDENTTQD